MPEKDCLLSQYMFPCFCECGNYHFRRNNIIIYQSQINPFTPRTFPVLTPADPCDAPLERPVRIALSKASQCTATSEIQSSNELPCSKSVMTNCEDLPTVRTVACGEKQETADEQIMVAPSVDTTEVIANDFTIKGKRSSSEQSVRLQCSNYKL